MVYDSIEGRWGNCVPPHCHSKVPGWCVTWPVCRQSCCCRGDVAQFPLPFCPRLPPAFPIHIHEHLHGGCCPGDEPSSARSAPIASCQSCPIPPGCSRCVAHPAAPRCAASARAKAKVSQGEVWRTKGRWQAFSASHGCLLSPSRSGTEESGRNTCIASVRSDCPSETVGAWAQA